MNNVIVTPITVYRITCKAANGKTQSKRCSTAAQAATFAARTRWYAWWSAKGHKHPMGPRRQQRSREYHDKLQRRFLTVFKKYIK